VIFAAPICGFTCEVQHSGKEDFGRGSELKALTRRVVVGGDPSREKLVVDSVEVGVSGQASAQPADGVLDSAFLPGAVGIAEEGADGELVGEKKMLGKLGAIVDGDGAS